jgi:peptidoglycan/LPS O-acetylase OafA/YrhL
MKDIHSIETQETPVGRFYRPELDVVRFLAFLLVYLHHTIPHSENYPRFVQHFGVLSHLVDSLSQACGFGLGLFFTLSAYLIGELLLREREATGSVQVKQFYIRRILRIWPLYYFGMLLGLVVAYLPGGEPSDVPRMGWFLVFLGAWQVAMNGLVRSPMNVLWSISVEEQFYLFAPWVAKFFSRRMIYGFCLLLLLVSHTTLYILGKQPIADYRIAADSLVQFEFFAVGILLCLILHGRLPKTASRTRLMLVAGCCLLWMTATYWFHCRFYDTGINPGSWRLIGGYAMAALGCILILVALLGVDRKYLPRWAVYLGRISFGLYVYHDFAIYLVRRIIVDPLNSGEIHNHLLRDCLSVGLGMVLPMGLTIPVAALSYRYLETPFLKMKKRHAVIESQPIAGGG